MTDTNVSSLVLKRGSNRYIFDPSGNLDLSNYYTKSEADDKYALKSHTHAISEITNLQSTLNGKAASNHTHSQYATTTAVTNAQNTANNALNVANSKSTLKKSHGRVILPKTDSPSLKLTDTALIVGFSPGTGSAKEGNVYIDGFNITLSNITYYFNNSNYSPNYIGGIGLKNNVITYNKPLNATSNSNSATIGTYI